MSSVSTNLNAIQYPESDGKPMGETDWHIDWTLRLRDMLKWHFRGQRVYVASDLLLYYNEGVPRDFVVPDAFVVLDCEQKQRRVFKTWEEERVPDAVFEFTSASTRRQDEFFKPRTYAEIGVREYFLFDPHGEYLDPPVRGYRLSAAGTYEQIVESPEGRLSCQSLGLTLEFSNGDLVIRDTRTNEPLLTEAKANAREANAKSHEAADAERRAAELADQNAIMKAELEQLRRQLKGRHGQ